MYYYVMLSNGFIIRCKEPFRFTDDKYWSDDKDCFISKSNTEWVSAPHFSFR